MTFAEFSAINRQRCEAPDGFDRRLDTTTLAHWALGVCEEAGEVAGVVYAMDHRPQKGKTMQDLADEIADVISYCDLLAQRMGRNLEDVLREKWNRVSERIGSPLRIGNRLLTEAMPWPSDIEIEIARQEAADQDHRHCWHSASDAAADNHDARCCKCSQRSVPTKAP